MASKLFDQVQILSLNYHFKPHLISMDNSYSVVFAHHSYQVCTDRQFVLQSRGIDSQIVQTNQGYALIVESRFSQQAQAEMSAYVDENVINAPPPSTSEPRYLNPGPGLIGYFLVLSIISIAAGFGLFGLDWYTQGRVDSREIYSGEIWRLATALTLHASGQHLVSNIGFGLFFLYFTGRYLGYGLAVLSMLTGGILGNAINVYMQGSTHLSIGASTAVFAMLGVLCGYVWRMKYFSQLSWSKRLGPIFGGIALLAFTGAGGENTDIGAHLWGFVGGLILGGLMAIFNPKIPIDNRAQRIYGLVALVLIGLAWLIAILN